MVGDTGIEPVTPTVSTFSAGRLVTLVGRDVVGYGLLSGWSCWLRWLVAVLVLHDRCTQPDSGAAVLVRSRRAWEPRAQAATCGVIGGSKTTPLPPGVMAFHRAGNPLVETPAGTRALSRRRPRR